MVTYDVLTKPFVVVKLQLTASLWQSSYYLRMEYLILKGARHHVAHPKARCCAKLLGEHKKGRSH
jgi:hypothetical protein